MRQSGPAEGISVAGRSTGCAAGLGIAGKAARGRVAIDKPLGWARTWHSTGARASRGWPGPVAALFEGGIMAEATIDPIEAEIGPIRADLGTILARSARRFGPKPALIAGGRTLTYGELHELCDRA